MLIPCQCHGETSHQSDGSADVFGFLLRLDAAVAFLGISVIVIQQRSGRRQTVQSRAERFHRNMFRILLTTVAVAECLRDKALMDNDYAANGYAQDMEQERVYAEARKRLK